MMKDSEMKDEQLETYRDILKSKWNVKMLDPGAIEYSGEADAVLTLSQTVTGQNLKLEDSFIDNIRHAFKIEDFKIEFYSPEDGNNSQIEILFFIPEGVIE